MKYVRAESLKHTCELLSEERWTSRILAGGTDVLVQNHLEMVELDLAVDLKSLAGMSTIEAETGGFRIGAGVSGAELGEDPEVKKLWPGVVEGMELIGSTQVQGRATLVVNLCNSSPAADSVPPLVAAEAVAQIFGLDGLRAEYPALSPQIDRGV